VALAVCVESHRELYNAALQERRDAWRTTRPAAAKRGLSRSISDAGWGKFISILRAKAEEAGRIWIEVDPRHTSVCCEKCGHAARENRVTQAAFECLRCSHRAQADEHVARNLLRAALALYAQAA
jgi:putative transposase